MRPALRKAGAQPEVKQRQRGRRNGLAQLCKDMEKLGRAGITEGADPLLASTMHAKPSCWYARSLGAILVKEH